MSKSIYEEAKKLITKAYNEQISMSEHDVIFDALEQAQKQEKLLKLYKELNECYKNLVEHESLIYSLNTWQSSQILGIKHKIKVLEKC